MTHREMLSPLFRPSTHRESLPLNYCCLCGEWLQEGKRHTGCNGRYTVYIDTVQAANSFLQAYPTASQR